MLKHNYYYDEKNKKAKRYYAFYAGNKFKTKEEYEQYIIDNNIPTETISYFRLSKYALQHENHLLGKWIDYPNTIPGTFYVDERDFSRYTFETKDEMAEFLNYYDAQDFHYCQQCFYDGYEGDEEDSIVNRANKILEELPEPEAFDPEKENKKFAHFIISYYPNSDRRATRKEAHLKQIRDIKAVTPHARIYIVAQGYNEDDYIIDPQITYLNKYTEAIGAQAARNECLKYFYASDYEYMIMSDDDAFIVPTPTVKNFYKELEENTQKFIDAHVDIVYSRNMQYCPFNEADVNNIPQHNENYVLGFARSSWLCWALFRNFKKAYNKEFYQNVEIDPTKQMGYDDTDFSFNLIYNNMHSFSCPLFQLLLLNSEEFNSSIFLNADNDPLYRVHNIKATYDKWITKNKYGAYDFERFRLCHGNPEWILIPREEAVDASAEITGRNTDSIKATVNTNEDFAKVINQYYL